MVTGLWPGPPTVGQLAHDGDVIDGLVSAAHPVIFADQSFDSMQSSPS